MKNPMAHWTSSGAAFVLVLCLARGKMNACEEGTPGLVFLHVGKNGGGTVKEAIRAAGHAFQLCHPRPCPWLLASATGILLNIRDPVDRFCSAFDWRNEVLCQARGETREPVSGPREGVVPKFPDRYCKAAYPEERAILDDFDRDKSTLAEALLEVLGEGCVTVSGGWLAVVLCQRGPPETWE